MLFYSAAGEASLTGSIPQLFDQRSVYNKTGHMTCVFPMGKLFGTFWAPSGASEELKVSFPYLQIAETKSACFAQAGVPTGIPHGKSGHSDCSRCFLKHCVRYISPTGHVKSQGENYSEFYMGHNCDHELRIRKINVSSVLKKKKDVWLVDLGVGNMGSVLLLSIISLLCPSLSLFWLIGWSYVVGCGALCILLRLKQILN